MTHEINHIVNMLDTALASQDVNLVRTALVFALGVSFAAAPGTLAEKVEGIEGIENLLIAPLELLAPFTAQVRDALASL